MSELISLTEAAKLVAKSSTTLRKLINDGKFKSVKNESGHHMVRRDDVLGYYAINSAPKSSVERGSEQQTDLVMRSMNEQISLMRETIERERKENVELRAQIRNLEGELLKVNEEIKSKNE